MSLRERQGKRQGKHHRSVRRFVHVLFGLCVGTALASATAAAEDVASFYKSHKLTMGAPSNAGGSYDAYMRLLARHIARFIPGEPSTVVQNVGAGGGMVLANQIYNTSPKDGSTIGMVRGTVVQEHVFENPQAKFDGRKFEWLGNMKFDYDTCIVSAASGIKTIKDFYTHEVVVGASGVGAQAYSFPIVYRDLLGMKFKVIAGYPGTPERLLAMERGEIAGACGITTTSFRTVAGSAAAEGKVILVAQAGSRSDPAFPDTPNILDEAKTPDVRAALEFLFAPLALGRPLAAPPGTPKDRVAALGKAVVATMRDREFLADADKAQIDIEVSDGAETAKIVDSFYKAPKDVVKRVQTALQAAGGTP
ncbi:MAG TPA: tripartite tricarboxylate transporter substrate-binding protein [Alphaproteobacteria bacterium]|nr:tripartite tricarboxylate transporter substrate-binding protein [Alphaproteobacteria bacterium]